MNSKVLFSSNMKSIIPVLPTNLMGFGNVPAEGIDDPIEVNALIIKSGSCLFFVISVDVLFVGERLKKELIRALKEQKIIGPDFIEEHFICAATHNHHAPAIDAQKPGLGGFDRRFFDSIKAATLALIIEAYKNGFETALLEHSTTQGKNLVVNRRRRVWYRNPFNRDMRNYPNQTAPVDDTIHIIRIVNKEEKELAILWNFGCHAVTHYSRARVTSDFPGYVRAIIRRSAGDARLPILFLQGFSGNLVPRKYNTSWFRRNPADLLNRIFYGPSFGPFSAIRQKEWMDALSNIVLAAMREESQKVQPKLEFSSLSVSLSEIMEGAPEGREFRFLHLALSDDISMILVTAEVMTEYVKVLQSISTGKTLIPVSCIDNSFGYFPLNQQISEGGYETLRFLEPFGLAGASFMNRCEQTFSASIKRVLMPINEHTHISTLKKTNNLINRESIAKDLHQIGIRSGDTVFFKADLFDLFLKDHSAVNYLLDSFLDAVGIDGTIVSASYTRSYDLSSIPEDKVFTPETRSTLGTLANLMLRHKDRVRSTHPIASVVAIGENANKICENHDPSGAPFLPFKNLSDLDGWMVIIGCVDSNPGFGSVHWTQHDLGLASQWRKRGSKGSYYTENGTKKLYIAQEIGGCSMGFGKFYSDYTKAGKLRSGMIGGVKSIAIPVRDALKIEKQILLTNPRYSLCSNPVCRKCRADWGFNKRDIPFYFASKLSEKIYKNSSHKLTAWRNALSNWAKLN